MSRSQPIKHVQPRPVTIATSCPFSPSSYPTSLNRAPKIRHLTRSLRSDRHFNPSGAMEEVQGVVKHVLLAKFKEGVSAEEIDALIKGYANLVYLIEPMKSFHWGSDVSVENMHQGFTHLFESTFNTVEGVSEYIAHPAHVEFAGKFIPALEKVIVFDYKPTIVSP